MAVVSRDQIKSWFRKGLKPLEVHFASWIDSFWHKNDAIPMSSIDGLNEALNQRTITIDDALSDSSTNPVQNRVVKQALDDLRIEVDSSLSGTSENPIQNKVVTEALGDKANVEHTHPMTEVEGLPEALNDKASADHNHNGVYQPAGNYAASDHTHPEYLTQHQDISHKQDKTDNSLPTTSKTIIGAIAELWNKFADYLKGIQHVTHAELVALRDNGELVPGQRYRITDYTCTTKQPETHSAGHVFDIIVTADDVSTLNENARAVKHTGDTYFSGSKLSTWKLKYCLDNDITRFAWADTESGKGVIYYLEDEFGNLAEYDFKNIQFKRFRATIKKEYEEKLGDSKFMFLQDNGEG